MVSLKTWIMAIRPRTLWASIAPVLVGIVTASKNNFDLTIALFTLAGALVLQVGVNLANDYFDFKKGADTSERKGPTRVMSAGLISESVMIKALVTTFILSVLIGLYLVLKGGPLILIIGIASILSALAYTAGPYPLAYFGFGDLFVFIFFGPVAVCATFFLQAGFWSLSSFLISIPLGLLSIAILTVNDVRDYCEDKQNNKLTLVVRFGPVFGKLKYTICLLTPFIIIPTLVWFDLIPSSTLISLPLVLYSYTLIRPIWKARELTDLNALLAKTAQLLIIFSVACSAGWLI